MSQEELKNDENEQEEEEEEVEEGSETENALPDIPALGLYEWKCLMCKATWPPTSSAYMMAIKHKDCTSQKRQVRLVNKKTGDILASTAQEAMLKGFIPRPGEVHPDEAVPAEAAAPPSQTSQIGQVDWVGGGFVRIVVVVPADYLTLFNLARDRFEKAGITLDRWTWLNAQARFEKDYRHELILAPIPEEE